MPRTTLLAAIALVTGIVALGDTPAAARGHSTSVQGSGGHGYVRSTGVARTQDGVSATRSTQTNAGYGATSSRQASHSNGAYAGSSQTTLNNGSSISRSASAQSNGDGTASYQASRTGVNGQTQAVSGTVSRTGPQ